MIDLLTDLYSSFLGLVSGLFQAGLLSARFARDTFRAHFNLIGQYTAPIEDEILGKKAPKPRELGSILGQIALTIIPLTVISWITALTIAPLLYNSAILFIGGYVRATNLALLGTNYKLTADKDLPWYRILYGIPGFLIGGAAGLASASVIALMRILINSWQSAWFGFFKVTDLALHHDDRLNLQDARSKIEKGFGLLGFGIGGLLGSFGFATAGLIRIAYNSLLTAKSLTVSSMNLVLDKKRNSGLKDDNRNDNFLIYGLGFPGLALGVFTSIVAISLIGLNYVRAESWKTTHDVFIAMLNRALPSTEDEALEEIQKRRIRDHILGAPGLVTGILLGSIGFGIVVAIRTFIDSFLTTIYTFNFVAKRALNKDDKHLLEIEPDNRGRGEKYGFGVFGLVVGGLSGALGFAAIGLGRILINSVKTAKNLTVSGIHWVRPGDTEDLSTDKRQDKSLIYGFGFPGLVFGAAGGAAGIAVVGLGRVGRESWITTKAIVMTMAMFALPAKDAGEERELQEVQQRPGRDRILGAPGLVSGIFFGSAAVAVIVATRTTINSFLTTIYTFAAVAKMALPKDDRDLLEIEIDNRGRGGKYGFGVFGLVVGGLSGATGFAAIGLGRILINSVKTAKNLTVSGIHLVRPGDSEDLSTDKRHDNFLIYGLGFPGLVFGAAGAAVGITVVGLGRVGRESWKTTKAIVMTMARFALPAKEIGEERDRQEEVQQRPRLDRFLGAPGLVSGIFFGSAAVAVIVTARTAINSFLTTIYTFTAVAKIALPKDDRDLLKIEVDSRKGREQYGFGVFGLVVGGLSGAAGFTAIGLGRILINSVKTAKNLTVSGIHLVRPGDTEDLSTDKRQDNFLIYGLGFPGLVFGAAGAAAGIAIVGLGRVGHESWKTTKAIVMTMARFVLPAKDADEAQDRQEEVQQSPRLERILGAPGLVSGIFFGSAAVAVIVTGRTMVNSFMTTIYTFAAVAKIALPKGEKDRLEIEADTRKQGEKYGFGVFGLVVGGLSGATGFAAIGLGRILINSVKTAKNLTVSGIHFVRPGKAEDLSSDKRQDNFLIYGLGFPGLVFGAAGAAAAIATVSLEHVARESWKTTKEIFSFMVRRAKRRPGVDEALYLDSDKVVPKIKRLPFDRFFIGALGIVPGLIAGSMGFAAIGMARVLYNSLNTGIRTFVTMTNLGLNKPLFETWTLEDASDDNRTKKEKYLLGGLGGVAGAGAGMMALGAIGSAKLAYHTFLSWRSLSGSLLNGGFVQPLFNGLAGDKRKISQKIVGGLGYALALAITWPVSAVIFAMKWLIPAASFLVIGLIISPFVATIKGIKLLVSPRFKKDKKDSLLIGENEDSTPQKFKNIYSALTPAGKLAENQTIQENQNGRKGPLCFIRKAISLNASTPTEKALDMILAAYDASRDKDTFFNQNGEFDQVIEDIKAHYRTLDCLETEYRTTEREEQIDDLCDFVRRYIKNDTDHLPERIYTTKKSWTSLFWGRQAGNGDENDYQYHASNNPF